MHILCGAPKTFEMTAKDKCISRKMFKDLFHDSSFSYPYLQQKNKTFSWEKPRKLFLEYLHFLYILAIGDDSGT